LAEFLSQFSKKSQQSAISIQQVRASVVGKYDKSCDTIRFRAESEVTLQFLSSAPSV
jgi:hypothetical protein